MRKIIGVCCDSRRGDERGSLETVHVGHLDVHEDQGEFVFENARRVSRPELTLTKFRSGAANRASKVNKVARLVIDEQDVDLADEFRFLFRARSVNPAAAGRRSKRTRQILLPILGSDRRRKALVQTSC